MIVNGETLVRESEAIEVEWALIHEINKEVALMRESFSTKSYSK